MAVTTIKRDIAPGEIFESTGPTRIEGNIGKGAQVTVNDGGLTVTGSVGDDAKLTTKDSKTGNTNSVENVQTGAKFNIGSQTSKFFTTGNTINVTQKGNGNIGIIKAGDGPAGQDEAGEDIIRQTGEDNIPVIENGQIATAATAKKNYGITVYGPLGNSVTLQSAHRIRLNSNAGTGLKAAAGNGFTGRNIGEGAYIIAGNGVIIIVLGGMSEVKAGKSARIRTIADYNKIQAESYVRAGFIGLGATVYAGTTLRSVIADLSAYLEARARADLKVGAYINSSQAPQVAQTKAATQEAKPPAQDVGAPERTKIPGDTGTLAKEAPAAEQKQAAHPKAPAKPSAAPTSGTPADKTPKKYATLAGKVQKSVQTELEENGYGHSYSHAQRTLVDDPPVKVDIRPAPGNKGVLEVTFQGDPASGENARSRGTIGEEHEGPYAKMMDKLAETALIEGPPRRDNKRVFYATSEQELIKSVNEVVGDNRIPETSASSKPIAAKSANRKQPKPGLS